MAPSEPDRARVRVPPPLVFFLVVVAGILLDRRVAPLTLGLDRLPSVVALVPFLGGVALLAAAMLHFHRTGQNPEPWKSTPELIFNGPYRITRNPMYVGMALLQAAGAVKLTNAWLLILLPLSLFGVYQVAVRHEEAYLERKFGDAFREYKGSVRRWL